MGVKLYLCLVCAFGLMAAHPSPAQSPAAGGAQGPPAAAQPASTPAAEPRPAASRAPDPQTPAGQTPSALEAEGEATGARAAAAPALTPAAAVAERKRPVTIPLAQQAPVIDGRLDDAAWAKAAVLNNFFQTRPGDNIAPSRPTEVLLTYDARFLYVAFRAADDPGKVRATVAKRDSIFDDDYAGILLDTYNDQRRAYALYFNPLGVQADAIYTEGRDPDYSFDIVMNSRGQLTDEGYTVEAAIPFKSLRFEPGKNKVWGIHAFRYTKRFNNEESSWMPLSREQSGLLSQAGQITGFNELASGRTLELIPSLTLSETGQRVRTIAPALLRADPSLLDPGRFVNQPVALDPGLTMKLGITSTITLDFALNPDFAQVEADQLVVTANQRFPIFFPEKRPFFLEGIDIFRSPLQAVDTRAIIDPDMAVKLSGKRGRDSFGVLFASDNAPGDFRGDERLDPVNAPFLDKNAYIGVVRLKRDVGKESTVGLIATTYNFIQRHNHLGGLDGRFRLDPQTVFTFQAVGTTSRRFFRDPELGRQVYRTGNAFGYSWNYDHRGRHFTYNFSGQGRTRDYRADVGFTRRVNTNRKDVILRYVSEPKPKATLISWSVSNSYGTNFDWQGRMQNWFGDVTAGWNFKHQTNFGLGFNGGYERVFEEEFGPTRTATRRGAFFGPDPERSSYRKSLFAFGDTTPSKKFSTAFVMTYSFGSLDFDFGGGPRFQRVSPAALLNPRAALDPGPGNQLDLSANVTWQPTDALRATLDYTKSRLVRNDTGLVAFDANIFSLRTTYQFTRFTFARARVDFDSLSSRVRGQYLLGWAPNPGTSFYAGYNDDTTRNGYNPFTAQLEPGFRRNGRTFFIKVSYLIRRNL
ncbi:MAG TPA: DUF5916 domain-containing protein [Pyrinomonadaceae bacterium]|jgi:hypothetical protein